MAIEIGSRVRVFSTTTKFFDSPTYGTVAAVGKLHSYVDIDFPDGTHWSEVRVPNHEMSECDDYSFYRKHLDAAEARWEIAETKYFEALEERDYAKQQAEEARAELELIFPKGNPENLDEDGEPIYWGRDDRERFYTP